MTDMNKNIIDYCNEKYNNNEKNVKTYKLVVDDEDDLPFDDHTFDLILTSLMIFLKI
jgi:ubiquinone/menaquinone biosynthesis C-methylase UbiE